MKKKYLVAGGSIGVVALAAVAWWHFGHATSSAAVPDAPADESSVLVVTQPVRQQQLPVTINTFGEIATGKPEALNFPQAGQLVRLAVVLGQQVRRGDLIATLNSDPTAVSSYAQAANAVGFARRELQRVQELLSLQLATSSQVDTARKALQDAEAALAAQSRLGGAQPRAQLDAPFDGVVTALPVAQGDRLAAGATVLQLGRSDRLRALLAIEPARSAQVKVGMTVAVTPVADNAGTLQARITDMQDVVDPKSLMLTAIAALPSNQQVRVVSGMRVQAAIQLGQQLAWAVPRQAVLTDDHGAYLFQVANQKAHRVDVAKVAEADALYGVSGKLDPGAPVVVVGNYELREGMNVREAAR
jgi:membrane fusion protein (multidrug efflux system)